MSGQTQKTKPTSTRGGDAAVVDMPAPQADAAALKAELDDLLDEIDGVLEENAEEFVAAYQQKGGE